MSHCLFSFRAFQATKSFSIISFRRNITAASRNPFFQISEEVKDAVETGRPVVALESAIYTHGFPYPENTALASHLESVVRINGGVPATTGILNGIAKVGLGAEELIELTSSAGSSNTRKVSRRDLPYICGLGYHGKILNGGTTVSGTMLLAHLAGIRVFATGGLGGVHRGAESSMDISADLTELGRTPVAVVSSGCKSFLDIPRTLEYLETQGASVMTFADGREGDVDFPAFWSRESGVKSPFTVVSEAEAAAIAFAQQGVPVQSGIIFANPIPEKYSIPKQDMELAISQALQDAKAAGSLGSDNTPFVLKRIREITKGSSVSANRALIESNVVRGTKLAVELSKIMNKEVKVPEQRPPYQQVVASKSKQLHTAPVSSQKIGGRSSDSNKRNHNGNRVIVAGSVAIDISCDYSPAASKLGSSQPEMQTSNPATIQQGLGGVASNVASALQYLGVAPRLCSAIGDDFAGGVAIDWLEKRGLRTDGIKRLENARTAHYVAMNDESKRLLIGMADMSIIEQHEPGHISDQVHAIEETDRIDGEPEWLVMDTNWSPATIQAWFQAGKAVGAKIALEPVSVAKSRRVFAKLPMNGSSLSVFPDHTINVVTPNALELASLFDAARETDQFERDDWFDVINSMNLASTGSRDKLERLLGPVLVDQGLPQQTLQLLPLMPCIITTLGNKGVLLTQLLPHRDDRLTSPDAAPYILSHSKDNSDRVGGVYMRLFPAVEDIPAEEIVSVNGAGDTFLGVLTAALMQSPQRRIEDVIDVAQKGSVMTLKSKEAVSPELSSLKLLL